MPDHFKRSLEEEEWWYGPQVWLYSEIHSFTHMEKAPFFFEHDWALLLKTPPVMARLGELAVEHWQKPWHQPLLTPLWLTGLNITNKTISLNIRGWKDISRETPAIYNNEQKIRYHIFILLLELDIVPLKIFHYDHSTGTTTVQFIKLLLQAGFGFKFKLGTFPGTVGKIFDQKVQ